MLKDTPPLRESSDSITSGTEAKFPTSRSMSFPPAYGNGVLVHIFYKLKIFKQ